MAWAVAKGQLVEDADGKRLGRVRKVYPWAFEVAQHPWSHPHVVGYDEVVGVRGDVVRISRSDATLFELAEGRLPRAWEHTLPLAPPPKPRRP